MNNDKILFGYGIVLAAKIDYNDVNDNITREEAHGDIKRYCPESRGQQHDRFPGDEWKYKGCFAENISAYPKDCKRDGICAKFFCPCVGVPFFPDDCSDLVGL